MAAVFFGLRLPGPAGKENRVVLLDHVVVAHPHEHSLLAWPFVPCLMAAIFVSSSCSTDSAPHHHHFPFFYGPEARLR